VIFSLIPPSPPVRPHSLQSLIFNPQSSNRTPRAVLASLALASELR
jgi:hypothetical protein